MPKNDYLRKMHDQKLAWMESAKVVFEQYNFDTCLIALNEEFGFGYDRLLRFENKWKEVYAAHFDCLNPDNVEADVLQDKLDAKLESITEGHQEFVPFQKRYPKIRDINYGKAKKGWK